MPVTRIKVTFNKIYANNSGDICGAGEWKLTAKVDGKAVGNPNQEFEVKDKETIKLPEDKWSIELDVREKKPNDKIEISLSAIDVDVLGKDDLGEAKMTLKYPFMKEYDNQPISSPVIKGWLFFPDHQYFQVYVSVKILEVKATAKPDKTKGMLVSRQNSGSSTFTTISGNAVEPRVEVCPVVPVPAAPSKLPPRPTALVTYQAEMEPGVLTEWGKPLVLAPGKPLNDLANPALIPVLKATDPDLDSKAAKIAVTWHWPGDLEVSKLTWHVKDGPIAIVGSNEGVWVKVRGTNAPTDQMATLELRWDGDKGPLLATYRAWVGVVKEVLYRVNIVDGVNKAANPALSPQLAPADVNAHMQMARILMWQSGIDFKPDPDKTCWDGATTTAFDGVFSVTAKQNNWTNNVSSLQFNPIATRLNFNPGVFNIAYVTSTTGGNAVATDVPGLTKTNETNSDTPSASWVLPTGVAPDVASKPVKMKSLEPHVRANASDAAYVTNRKTVQPSFTTNDIRNRLYGVIYPSNWGTASGNQHHDWAQNLAHELGHVLGLLHRGNGGHVNGGTVPGILSDDGVDSSDLANTKRGHPWAENVMGYDTTRGLDLDLIQTPVVRRHPGAKPKV